jgi:hypothetical protein
MDWLDNRRRKSELECQRATEREVEAWDMWCRITFLLEIMRVDDGLRIAQVWQIVVRLYRSRRCISVNWFTDSRLAVTVRVARWYPAISPSPRRANHHGSVVPTRRGRFIW